MDTDAARHELVEALALLHEHLADLATVEQKRVELSATATAADGTVAVTVTADGVVSKTFVDQTYLERHDLEDLGGYVTAAAQAAARDVARRTDELLAPLAERRARFPSLSDVVEGAPDVRNLLLQEQFAGDAPEFARGGDRDGDAGHYPIVRSWR